MWILAFLTAETDGKDILRQANYFKYEIQNFSTGGSTRKRFG